MLNIVQDVAAMKDTSTTKDGEESEKLDEDPNEPHKVVADSSRVEPLKAAVETSKVEQPKVAAASSKSKGKQQIGKEKPVSVKRSQRIRK